MISLLGQVRERPKIVEKAILQEKPTIQFVEKKVQLIREVTHSAVDVRCQMRL